MCTLREIKNNYFDKIYFIFSMRRGTVINEENINGNRIEMVSNQKQSISCEYENNSYTLKVLVLNNHDNVEGAWLLPFLVEHAYGIRIPKKLKGETEGYLLTPSLTGCSIHIIDDGENWLIIHDARKECSKVDTKSKKTHNLWFSTENCVSYEWSELGYRFVKGGIDLEKLGTNVDMSDSEVKSMAANVMFYYDSTEGWIILTHKTYGVESIGGSEKPLSAFFEERER